MLALASLLMRFSDTKAWKARLASLKRCMHSDFFMISLFRTLPFRWIRCARDCLFLVPFFSFALLSFVFSVSLFPTSFFFFKYDQMNTTFFPSSYASLSHLLFCGSFLVLFFFFSLFLSRFILRTHMLGNAARNGCVGFTSLAFFFF